MLESPPAGLSLRFHSEGLAPQQIFGAAGAALTDRLFDSWHAYLAHNDRDRFAAELTPVQTELRELLEHTADKRQKQTHKLCGPFASNLLKPWPALWTFITAPGVTPTNNAAERALRGPVIHRKLSHGNQSDDGERFTERSLSASCSAARVVGSKTATRHRPGWKSPRAASDDTRLGGHLVVDPTVSLLEPSAKCDRRLPAKSVEDHRVVAVATTHTRWRAEIITALESDPCDVLDEIDKPIDRDSLGATDVDRLIDVARHDLERALEAVIDIHETASLLAVAPDVDLVPT